MPPIPPRATAVATALAILLALAWLHSSGEPLPAVPTGLSIQAAPADPAEPRQGAEATGTGRFAEEARTERWDESKRRGPAKRRDKAKPRGPAKRRDKPKPRGPRKRPDKPKQAADRAGGDVDARAPVEDRGARARSRQDPPAAPPRPGGSVGGAAAQARPEFAIG